jgi:DNA-directed RNA polymerase subunit beta'
VEANIESTAEIRNKNIVKNSEGVPIVMGRNTEIILKDERRGKSRPPYSVRRKLTIEDGAKVKPGQKMAEWDPYTLPVLTEKDGVAHFFDLVEGVSVTEQMDEATGISNKKVIDWRSQPKGSDLKPRISLLDKKGKIITLPNGLPANYYLPVDTILSVENGQDVKAGDIIARIPRESSKTRDITGGLPRVAELFEARRPKDFAVISDIDGYVEFGKDYKSKRRIIVKPSAAGEEPREYLIPKGRHLAVHEGDFVRKGDALLDGAMVPHDILDVSASRRSRIISSTRSRTSIVCRA